jgi:hypothetical protein
MGETARSFDYAHELRLAASANEQYRRLHTFEARGCRAKGEGQGEIKAFRGVGTSSICGP